MEKSVVNIPTELTKSVSRSLANDGREMTPDQVSDCVKYAFRKLRRALRRKGLPAPSGDLELLDLLCDAIESEDMG